MKNFTLSDDPALAQQQQVALDNAQAAIAALRARKPKQGVMAGTVVPTPNFIPGSPGAMTSTRTFGE